MQDMRVNQQPSKRELGVGSGKGEFGACGRTTHRLVKKFSAALGSRLLGASAAKEFLVVSEDRAN